jgi:hypothetical protein
MFSAAPVPMLLGADSCIQKLIRFKAGKTVVKQRRSDMQPGFVDSYPKCTDFKVAYEIL